MKTSHGAGRGRERSGTASRAEAPQTPESVEEALARARDHARNAIAEAARAARCLLDAASLAATGVPASGHSGLRRAAAALDRAATLTAASPGDGAPWLEAVRAGLDAEIARWEERSRSDPEARAVLRAFLGVREVLWELGLRPVPGEGKAGPSPEARPSQAPAREARSGDLDPRRPLRRSAPGRLERVPVEG